MSVDDAIELGRRSIYHATFRDCASGGTVSGELALPCCMSTLQHLAQVAAASMMHCLLYVTIRQQGPRGVEACVHVYTGARQLW
jgi:hypothetical protein